MPFLLSDFVDGKIARLDLGSNDFDLALIDDSSTYSGSTVHNTQEEEDGDSKSSVKVHESYDYTTGDHTPPALTGPVALSNDDNGEQ